MTIFNHWPPNLYICPSSLHTNHQHCCANFASLSLCKFKEKCKFENKSNCKLNPSEYIAFSLIVKKVKLTRLIYYYVTANKGWFWVNSLNGGQKLVFWHFCFFGDWVGKVFFRVNIFFKIWPTQLFFDPTYHTL